MRLHPLTPVPAPFSTGPARRDWEALLEQLLTRGILYRSENQPILSRDGSSARWMLESWPVSLSSDGLTLAARCLLKLLEPFEGRQLATYGMTGIPLLSACVQLSGGKYTGLVVRKERKAHGSRKLTEGAIDRDEPVVLVDDSVSSGLSSYEACARLEEAGLFVEGGVCLVRFGYKGGFSFMQAQGRRMAAVFDVWSHLMRNMADEQVPAKNPSLGRVLPPSAKRRAPEGLDVPALARAVIAHQLERGEVLRAPRRVVDAGALDARGGAWVSLRSKQQIHHRYARDGFWRFPEDEGAGSAAQSVVRAAALTARQLERQLGDKAWAALEDSAIAVTTFSPLEQVQPGDLDNDRYGIVVRSAERDGKLGGALPRMPGIEHSWRQHEHARRKNAGLEPHEAYQLFRHDVFKRVEAGTPWQPTGVPRAGRTLTEREEVCAPIVGHALALARATLNADAPPPALSADVARPIEQGCDAVYVTVYRQGRVVGCRGSALDGEGALNAKLPPLVVAALADPRFAGINTRTHDDNTAHERLAVSVSFLTAPLVLGRFTSEEVMQRVRLGEQALMAQEGDKAGLLLPFVAAQHDLSRVAFARDVLKKAGITSDAASWTRYDVNTWIDDGSGARKLLGAFPAKRPSPRRSERARLVHLGTQCARYLTHHQRADGDHYLVYAPLTHRLSHVPDLARLAHGAWLLARAAPVLKEEVFEEAARARVAFLARRLQRAPAPAPAEEGDAGPTAGAWLMVPGVAPTLAEIALLVATSIELEGAGAAPFITPLLSTLAGQLDQRGRFCTHRDPALATDAWQDYTPAQALLAIGLAHEHHLLDLDEAAAERLVAAWRRVRLRCEVRPHPGQVAFVPQAAAVWHRLTGDDALADATFALTDWIGGFQTRGGRTPGAFLNDHQPDTPGFTTALYVEGLSASGLLALQRGDARRARRALARCLDALGFLETLVIDEQEAAVLPDPALATGGVRPSHLGAQVRIDMPGHTLAACLGTLALLDAVG